MLDALRFFGATAASAASPVGGQVLGGMAKRAVLLCVKHFRARLEGADHAGHRFIENKADHAGEDGVAKFEIDVENDFATGLRWHGGRRGDGTRR